MAGDDDIRINLETLYELLRQEKTKNELQHLPRTFYQDVIDYLETKRKELPTSKIETLTSITERYNSHRQIDNAQAIIKQLYERREKKIINLAIGHVRTGTSQNPESFLPQETELFTTTSMILKKFKENILDNILKLNPPPQSIKFFSEQKKDKVKKNNFLSVRFISPIPKFMGLSESMAKTFGPYKEDDIATLPRDIVKQLIKKKRIEIIKFNPKN